MKFSNKLRNIGLAAAALLFLQSASSYAARCEYIIQSEWGTGFTAAVRITNDTTTSISGWSVNWSYSDGSTRTSGWNANVSGSNPYTATSVGWNDKINPGQFVEFGIQGNKGVQNAAAAKPAVTGAVCGGSTSSASSVRSSSSSILSSSSSRISSSIPSSSRSSSSIPSSSSVRSSSSVSVPGSSSAISFSSSSLSTSSAISTSSSSSSNSNTAPTADLQVTTHGLTVYIDASASTDADGNTLVHTIDFGDGTTIKYPKVWHTYKQAGSYEIGLSVSDGQVSTDKTQQVSVVAADGNQAPIARLTGVRDRQAIRAWATSSFDVEGIPLTYEWDFGDGPFAGNASSGKTDCTGSDSPYFYRYLLVTVTVSDGELKDTRQATFGGYCGGIYDLGPTAKFSYSVLGNTVYVDARDSTTDVGFTWTFGDGATGVGLLASHTYASSGTYDIGLKVAGPVFYNGSTSKSVTVGSVSSSSSVISSSSSSRSSSSQASSDRNRYTAPRATTAPIIDGAVDSVWESASWAPIDVFWLGTQSNPSAQDYSGRYKALWDENYLYILYDVTDDKIFDGVRDALDRYWEDDTVELFIDENKNGGQHGYNTSAWAYHVSTYGDVVDSTTGGAKLLNDHIDVRLVSNGNQHYWEMRVRIFDEDYADWKTNTPLTLTAGKLLGFSASYIDNDGSSQRESMMGSVDTQGHKNNQGYLDASVFGSLLLVE